MTVKQHVHISPTTVVLNGQQIDTTGTGEEMLKRIYRERIGNYPKFFKMDVLCKLGFIASELLLQQESDRTFDKKGIVTAPFGREDRAVFFFNRNGSICDDIDYQQTIVSAANSIPSPSLFVYTLPNIVTGEIAIRNRYSGETGFYVLPSKNEALMGQIVRDAFTDHSIRSVLTGWLDCADRNCFEADVYLLAGQSISPDCPEHISGRSG